VVGEGFSAAMDTHIHTFIQAKHLSDIPAKQLSDIQAKHLFEACRHLHEAESRINRQQKLAEKLQRQGHAREARRAREMLAMFVRSYFVMQDHRRILEFDLSAGAPQPF